MAKTTTWSVSVYREQRRSRFLLLSLVWACDQVLIVMSIILVSHLKDDDITYHIMRTWRSRLLNNTLTCVTLLTQEEWEKGDWFDCVADLVKLMDGSCQWGPTLFWHTELSQRNWLVICSLLSALHSHFYEDSLICSNVEQWLISFDFNLKSFGKPHKGWSHSS